MSFGPATGVSLRARKTHFTNSIGDSMFMASVFRYRLHAEKAADHVENRPEVESAV